MQGVINLGGLTIKVNAFTTGWTVQVYNPIKIPHSFVKKNGFSNKGEAINDVWAYLRKAYAKKYL